MHVLLVEDDHVLADGIARILRGHAMTVDVVDNGEEADRALISREVSVAVLDIGLPGIDGFEVVRRLRSRGSALPVLLLTARDDVQDRVRGLETGADDYLVKPFALQEVEARLQVLARRTKTNLSRTLAIADLEFNLDTLEVRRGGDSIQLNPTALKILQALMEASPSVVTRNELETRVWGEELPDSDSLRVHIHGLRAAIDKPFPAALIQTRHGIGYRIVDPDAVPA